MESIVGKILCDRYRILKEFGHDDFSSVYLAEDLGEGDTPQCHVERLIPSYDSEVLGAQSWRKVLQAFVDQGNVLKNISQHPQIPKLLAFFECDREFYLVHELIPGETLQEQLEHNLIDEAIAVEWLREILGILEFIHQGGISHLNIQPSSLIQHQDGRKFLTNFAVIKNFILFSHKGFKSIANHNFSALEQQEGKADLTTDIYALGKTIIYALTGQVAEFIYAKSLSTSTPTSPIANILAADISPKLADILNKMVEDSPSRRYQSATEVLAELNLENQNVVFFPPPLSNNNQFYRSTRSQKSPNKGNYDNPKNSSFKSIKVIVWSLLILPFVVALAIVFLGIKRNYYQYFSSYVDNNYQFTIKYPQDWLRKDLDDPITGEVVVFTSPVETSTDLFLEKVYIAVEYLPGETTTLEEYGQTVFDRIEQDKENNIEVYQDHKTKIDKFPARMIVYSRKEERIQLKQMEVFTIKNDRVYIAIYTAERAKYSKFLETAEKIIDSWEIE